MPLLQDLTPVRQYIPQRWRDCALGYMDWEDVEQIAAITVWSLAETVTPPGMTRDAFMFYRVNCALFQAWRHLRWAKASQADGRLQRQRLALWLKQTARAQGESTVLAHEMWRQLTPDQQAVLALAAEEYTDQEIAARLGLTEAAVCNRRRRVRNRMRRHNP